MSVAESATPKILFLIDDLPTGGIEKMLASILRHLDRREYLSEVVTLFGLGPVAQEISDIGIPVRCLHLSKINFPVKLIQLAFMIFIGKFKIIYGFRIASRVLGTVVGRFCGVRLVSIRWDSEPSRHGSRWRSFDRVAATLAHHLQACSVAVSLDVRRLYRLGSRRIDVIYNAIELWDPDSLPSKAQMRRDLNIGENDAVIGTVANLNWRKDYPTLIRASKLVVERYPGTVFVSVGDGPDRASLMDLTRRLSIHRNWRFLGRRSDVREVLRSFDVFVLSSVTEGFGIALLEAMWAALPCIGSNVGGIPELIEDGMSGLLFPAGSPQRLAEAVTTLLDSPELRKKLGAGAKEKVANCFTVEQMVANLVRKPCALA